jgi:outer membrane protein assembly factor BamB
MIGACARTLLAALVLVLGKSAAAGQFASTGNRGPVLLWRVATPPNEDWVLELAPGKDGIIYSRSWVGNNIYAFGPDGAVRRKLSVGIAVRALAVGKDGTIYAGSGDSKVYVFGPMARLGRALLYRCREPRLKHS